jgi:hypothetical protein
MRTLRLFLLVEALAFLAASQVHAGLIAGYEHPQARIAENVIALVLVASLATSWIRPAWTRGAGLAGQAFALLGTLVGIIMIAIGIGPRTGPDIVYHVGIVVVLIWGLGVAWRLPREGTPAGPKEDRPV